MYKQELIRTIYVQCANCKKITSRIDPNTVTVNVTLNESIREYVYCSKKCYENKLKNFNSTTSAFGMRLKIIETKIIRDNPLVISILTAIEDFKLEEKYVR